jgi:hypothetical protein
MTSHATYVAIALGIVSALPLLTAAQNKTSPDSPRRHRPRSQLITQATAPES